MKFCINCRHSTPPLVTGMDVGEFTKCNYTFPNTFHLVTGEPLKQAYVYCIANRRDGDEKLCGPEGRFFEPKGCTMVLDNGQPCGDEGRLCVVCEDARRRLSVFRHGR